MKYFYRHIALIILAIVSLQSFAVEEPHDTVYFYDTWEQIFYNEPVAMFVDPYIEAFSYSLDIWTNDNLSTSNIDKRYIAAYFGDDNWFINTHYLYKNFDVDLHYLNHYVPLFFNEKLAYTFSVANISFKDLVSINDESDNIDYYYIDFVNHKVRRVNPTVLSELLEDYHDLQMRYEGMKDYKKRKIIEDYFFKYIRRATDDVMHPYILDLVEDDDAILN